MQQHDLQYYKDLAAINAAELEVAKQTLALADEQTKALVALTEDRAALASIVREGRKVRFMFVRNNEPFIIEMYGTWDDDVEGWKKKLLEKSDK